MWTFFLDVYIPYLAQFNIDFIFKYTIFRPSSRKNIKKDETYDDMKFNALSKKYCLSAIIYGQHRVHTIAYTWVPMLFTFRSPSSLVRSFVCLFVCWFQMLCYSHFSGQIVVVFSVKWIVKSVRMNQLKICMTKNDCDNDNANQSNNESFCAHTHIPYKCKRKCT